jgi:site-specific DNA-methyltransferase (adenine-specific)
MNSVHYSSKRPDWGTPNYLYKYFDWFMHFDVDVCADDQNHKHENYWTIKDNCLDKDWGGLSCWMNPPYGREIAPFVKKASTEGQKRATWITALLPARTDTAWWHKYVMTASTIYFIEGRIKFVGADNGAPFPSAVVIWSDPHLYSPPRITGVHRDNMINLHAALTKGLKRSLHEPKAS